MILVDEHIPLMTVATLRGLGHDLRDVRGTVEEGIADDGLWAIAQQEGRLLITTDKGFLRFRLVHHHGLLIVRLRRPNRQRINDRIVAELSGMAADWCGLTVVLRDVARSQWRASQTT